MKEIDARISQFIDLDDLAYTNDFSDMILRQAVRNPSSI